MKNLHVLKLWESSHGYTVERNVKWHCRYWRGSRHIFLPWESAEFDVPQNRNHNLYELFICANRRYLSEVTNSLNRWTFCSVVIDEIDLARECSELLSSPFLKSVKNEHPPNGREPMPPNFFSIFFWVADLLKNQKCSPHFTTLYTLQHSKHNIDHINRSRSNRNLSYSHRGWFSVSILSYWWSQLIRIVPRFEGTVKTAYSHLFSL